MRATALALSLLAMSCLWAPDATAEEFTMTVGAEAPAIDIEHWIKGVAMDDRGAFTPVTTFEPGKIYLLEFWATWCGPCVGSMPHLSELQTKHADEGVTIIGISDETLPKVFEFLHKTDARDGRVHNDRATYTITTDPDGSVMRDYFRAAGQRGIPCGFLIGPTGHVEWIGDPRKVDEPLEAVLAGTWDRAASKATFEEDRRIKQISRDFMGKYRKARGSEDWAGCLALLDENDSLGSQRARGLEMERFEILLVKLDRKDEAYAGLTKHIEDNWDRANSLNEIAWTVVDQAGLPHRDLDLALRAAERANELLKGEDAPTLDTLARIYHDRGDLSTAVEFQRQAAAKVQGRTGAMPDGIRKVLATYEAALAAAPPAVVSDTLPPSDG